MEAPRPPSSSAPAPPPPPPTVPRCGGKTSARQLLDQDKDLFEDFRDIIEKKLQEQFDIPKDYKIKPTKVQTQVVAGTRYFFYILLPNDKFARVKVFKPLKGHALDTGDRPSLVTVEKETYDD
ncbi:unnamed protein product [Adineta steineri]|uniref:Cystatin domain-containing protein n=1 Tax=Adineta steineri TaxID=433720 RepID=A0A813ZEF9_9BILA|nr:unnamed protein product [Adineta steineri]CAF1573504.1 unnamed protein product [Adineta steineri]